MIAQRAENTRRLKTGGFIYSSTIAALANNTYVLRSTTSGKADILVAFRVIRQDADGSLHILWKNSPVIPRRSLNVNQESSSAVMRAY